MRRWGIPVLALWVSVLGIAVMAQNPLAPPQQLLAQVVGGMPANPQQEIRVLEATLGVGQASVLHTHRRPVTVYVLQGTYTLQPEGQPIVSASAGQAIVEPANVKLIARNLSPAAPAKVIYFYVSNPGEPFFDTASPQTTP